MKEFLQCYMDSINQSLTLIVSKQECKEISLKTEVFPFNGIRTAETYHFTCLREVPLSLTSPSCVMLKKTESRIYPAAIFSPV